MSHFKDSIKKYFPEAVLFAMLFFFSITFTFQIYTKDIFQYPYIDPDSWDWFVNSFLFLGKNVEVSYRSLIFPLIIAFFTKLGLFNLVNFTGLFALTGITIVNYFINKFVFGKNFALISSLIILFNAANWGFALLPLADLLTVFISEISILFFWKFFVTKKVQFLYISFAISAIAGLTQYSGFFLFPVYLAFIFLFLKKEKKFRKLLLCTVIFLIIALPYFIYRFFKFGNPFYSLNTQFYFLKPTITNFDFYIWIHFVYFSIPVVLTFIAGILKFLKRLFNKKLNLNSREKFLFFNLVLLLANFFFFCFCYSWGVKRFLIYWMVQFVLFSTCGLYSLKHLLKNVFCRSKYWNARLFYILGIAGLALILVYSNFYSGDPLGNKLLITNSLVFEKGKLYRINRAEDENGSFFFAKNAQNIKDYKEGRSIISEYNLNALEVRELINYIKTNYNPSRLYLYAPKEGYIRENQFKFFFEGEVVLIDDFDVDLNQGVLISEVKDELYPDLVTCCHMEKNGFWIYFMGD